MISFRVPGPVRGKGRPRATVRGGFARLYTDGKTRSYEAEVKFFALQAMAGRPPLDGPVEVRFDAVFAVPTSASKRARNAMLSGEDRPTKKPDADNILKIADALNGVVFLDDKQIVMATVLKRYGDADALEISVHQFRRTHEMDARGS